ncbi:hypothetical protein [Alkalicoccus luteus]|uniref:Uncharacterized protein n=1 Tax=Alkalicoccus luteus TaxID=1237094 RepID=A0A969TV39_9BACI|nr:hypothetical protein [Alkalicoccus luteus]NJP38005.1 hypothetical protein [Alkalicoccus luteus]
MSRFDVRSESASSYRNVTALFITVLLLLFGIIILTNVLLGTISWESFYMDVMTSLIGIMLPLVLFNVIYEKVTRRHQKIETANSVAEALMLDKGVLSRFSEGARKGFIKNSTESLLGERAGGMLYTTLIRPYLENKYHFRRRFRYHISYSLKRSGMETSFPEEDYYWVEEDLSFYRSLNIFQLKKRRVTVGFSYWESDLEELFKGEGVFFRENLFIGSSQKKRMQQMTNEELQRFVEEVMQFSFALDEKSLPFTVENSENGFYLQFDMSGTIEAEADREYKFHYHFHMPQLKTIRKFVSIVSEPTQQVDILFTHADPDVRIVPVPFFDDSEAVSYLPNNIVKIELDQWVLPRSGCVFIWDEPEAESVSHMQEERIG